MIETLMSTSAGFLVGIVVFIGVILVAHAITSKKD
jgi:ABC-type antimicrobial peptide transport system permease subunit